jgi:ribonucleotide monophosphatase NagD (HAD superfamily)
VAGARGESLATSYDLVMFDLDGVVYVDGHAVDHAA